MRTGSAHPPYMGRIFHLRGWWVPQHDRSRCLRLHPGAFRLSEPRNKAERGTGQAHRWGPNIPDFPTALSILKAAASPPGSLSSGTRLGYSFRYIRIAREVLCHIEFRQIADFNFVIHLDLLQNAPTIATSPGEPRWGLLKRRNGRNHAKGSRGLSRQPSNSGMRLMVNINGIVIERLQ
uniref:Uncharacterized protein n=1 Tax=Candidatus Kentrum eta TaxID=2126337 RepID=A0A450V0X4_9GAMM|nr:MAG: hypothetical protein BECKH772A_GA0070896_1002320 [Candidatus Kentron sp. H]VFJ91795.1 MAG: hypothetical protein BECKH772B_GA0070898_1002120 [Candidatus Kentron sp. H]VFJ98431.1 MAG: hypothetical protein BECKH772C_GA0070978_1002120 [Candidatus Kentron sp. H]